MKKINIDFKYREKINIVMKNSKVGLLVSISLWIITLLFLPVSVQAQCPNLDFSMGNFTNWSPYTGTCTSTSTNIKPSAVVAERHTIMNAAQLMVTTKMKDEKCDSINKVPSGFNYSARLGNSNTGSQMEALEYTMTIDSTNSLLILHFAWVMQDPSHPSNQQPRFTMTIKDSTGKAMTGMGSCSNVNFIASQNLSNLVCKTNTLVARNWTTVGFSLEPWMGQKIKIYFETRDCTQGAHYGYAYMVGECRPMSIDIMFCEDQDTAYLSAPDGFINYKWQRSSQPEWKKEGSKELCQNIIIDDPVDGEEFTCTLLSELNNDCSAILRALVARTVINANFLYGIKENGGVDIVGHDSICWYDTCSRTATFVDLSSVKNSKKASIIWEIPNLNAVSRDSLFTYTFPSTDTVVEYLVRLTVFTTNGCVKTVERYITIYPLPVMDSIEDTTLCAGVNQTINFTGTNININNSTWTNNNPAIGLGANGKGNISFTTANTGTTPLIATITVTPKNNSGCTGISKTFTITVNPLAVMDTIEDIVLCAEAYQEINFTGTNIDLDSSTWTNNNTAIGLGASGKGNISFTATNTGITPLTAIVTMTPKSNNGCTGISKTFTITVNPLPVTGNIENIVLCAEEKQEINFTGTNIDLDSSTWTNSNTAIG
ncbi:MAG: hypothetical protein LBE13_05025, partial [Bacteroidales bacterium]|nr:hypothetical protein [Bacteroidales bacterium]